MLSEIMTLRVLRADKARYIDAPPPIVLHLVLDHLFQAQKFQLMLLLVCPVIGVYLLLMTLTSVVPHELLEESLGVGPLEML